MKEFSKRLHRSLSVLAIALVSIVLVQWTAAQDRPDRPPQDRPDQQQDDPPSRVARLGYLQGSISFQPAGESEWVEAAQNRPMTTGDKIWSDRDSRAELSLGSAVIDLNSNTGISFLNLDDNTAQVQLSSGSISVRVRRMDRDDVFEIDTPNQAFTISRPGSYRVEASDDGRYSVVSIREGAGESTGNGQTYTLRSGQRATFEGSDRLNAQVEDLSGPDDFDNWISFRERRSENSPSARYVSHDVVGYEDLDENGDWSPDPSYGNVWYPHVAAGWAPYRQGHWAWIDPWGWTWVDDEPWGYAPFHYGRWLSIRGRWGWVPGPPEVRPVYAPALVVFVGGGPGGNGNMGWFPLGPREVYVPSYRVSREYVNRVNVSNTTVNNTTVTNVYNTTIINKTTTINNVTYVNKNVSGAVTAVPQHAFASGQPVARSAVAVNARELAAAPVQSRAEVAPTPNSVLGVHSNTANRVAAPPAAVANRQVIAKATVPPPPVSFAARQQQLAAHPGRPIDRQEMQRLKPATNVAAAQPPVKQAPPGKPATPTMGRPASQPANAPANQPPSNPPNRPGTQPAANEHPAGNPPQPNNRPEPSRPQPNQPASNNNPAEHPEINNHPATQPNGRPQPNAQPESNGRPEPNQPQPSNRPEPNHPQPNPPAPNNSPAERPATNNHPPAAQPNGRPEPNTRPEPNARPEPNNRPESNQPSNRPEANHPQPNQPSPNNSPAEHPANDNRPPAVQPNNRPQPQHNEPAARPSNSPTSPQHAAPPAQPQHSTPEEKKKQDEKHKQQPN